MTRVRAIFSLLGLSACALVMSAGYSATPPKTTVNIVGDSVTLTPVGKDGDDAADKYVGQLMVSAGNLPAPDPSSPLTADCITGAAKPVGKEPKLVGLCDIKGGPAQIVVNYTSRYAGVRDTEHRWSVDVEVSGKTLTAEFERYATVVIDNSIYWLNYKLTPPGAKTAVTATLAITQPPKNWVVSGDTQYIQLQTKGTGVPLRQFAVVNSTLQDSETHNRINADAFELCATDETPCVNTGFALQPGDIVPIFLRAKIANMKSGDYQGKIAITANGKTLANEIELNLYKSTKNIKLFGVLLIALGVMLGVYITIIAPHRLQRLENLRPAIILRDSAIGWEKRATMATTKTVATATLTRETVSQIIGELDSALLVDLGYVAAEMPLRLKLSKTPVETYAAYLKRNNDALFVCSEVIARGLEPLAARWPDFEQNAAHLPLAKTALGDIDQLSRTAERKNVTKAVLARLSKLDTEIANTGARLASVDGRTVDTSLNNIAAGINSINMGAWLIWAIITILTGAAALIMTDPGFGTARDLFTCFGWGLGLQVVGPQLQQITTGKISEQLKLAVPS